MERQETHADTDKHHLAALVLQSLHCYSGRGKRRSMGLTGRRECADIVHPWFLKSLLILPPAAMLSGSTQNRGWNYTTPVGRRIQGASTVYHTHRVCYGKICGDECHSKSEIMLVARAVSVCDLFIKSVAFFWSGVSEMSCNITDSLRGLLTMPVILLKDKPIHLAVESYQAS